MSKILTRLKANTITQHVHLLYAVAKALVIRSYAILTMWYHKRITARSAAHKLFWLEPDKTGKQTFVPFAFFKMMINW